MYIIGVLSELICFLFISDRFPVTCHLSSLHLAGSGSQHCVSEGVDNIHHFHPLTIMLSTSNLTLLTSCRLLEPVHFFSELRLSVAG